LPVDEPEPKAAEPKLVEADLVDVVPKFAVEADPRHADDTTQFQVDQDTHFDFDATPEPEVPRQVTPEEERELSGVRRALDDLDVPPVAYRIGEPADRTWGMRTVGNSWEVAWFDHGPNNPTKFDRVDDAAAFLIGKLVLSGRRAPRRQPPPPMRPQGPQTAPQPQVNGFREEGRRQPVLPPRPPEAIRIEPPQRPEPPVPVVRPEPPRTELLRPEPPRAEPPPRPEPPRTEPPRTELLRPEPSRSEPPSRPEPPRQEQRPEPEAGAKRNWPIKPMNGEPPLTLFRHKKMIELPAGFEIDRFGEPNGNLVYAAGTPFEERSLVPSWINRAYRVYRLRRPVEVLTGVAVPWFEQPGGGTAYLFPMAVEDMVADGFLVEVSHQEAQH
jgi:hypothetical protein